MGSGMVVCVGEPHGGVGAFASPENGLALGGQQGCRKSEAVVNVIGPVVSGCPADESRI